MKIFVDTGGWTALFNRKDKYHPEAVKLWKELLANKANIYTTNYIIDETITLVRKRAGFHSSVKAGEKIFESKIISRITVNEALEKAAWKVYKKYEDKDFSFTDCTSFAVMEQNRIKSAFAFDEHFTQYGLSILPNP